MWARNLLMSSDFMTLAATCGNGAMTVMEATAVLPRRIRRAEAALAVFSVAVAGAAVRGGVLCLHP